MDWKRAFTVTSVIGLPIIALLAYGMTRDPRDIPSPLPGRPAPPFSRAVFATGADLPQRRDVGDTVRLADQKGKVVVLNYWASWCLACRTEHADLSDASRELASRGVQFYGMLYNDKEANGLQWIEQMGGQAYPSLSDPGARTAIDYGLYGVPETFVIDPRGIIARKFTGPVTRAMLVQTVDSILQAGTK
jgi:cytochrome c biogenesis protein CcmG/thiol:disulfide interchange protein DsbE